MGSVRDYGLKKIALFVGLKYSAEGTGAGERKAEERTNRDN
jgi:hypothetical protein